MGGKTGQNYIQMFGWGDGQDYDNNNWNFFLKKFQQDQLKKVLPV